MHQLFVETYVKYFEMEQNIFEARENTKETEGRGARGAKCLWRGKGEKFRKDRVPVACKRKGQQVKDGKRRWH